MGIKGLAQLLCDMAPNAVRENKLNSYFGRRIAIDASMSIYQFLVAVRQDGSNLTGTDGETTSHLIGLFYRTIRLADNGIKPVYVFDGKAPEMKSLELKKRAEKRSEAEKELTEAKTKGDVEMIDKFSKRLVKVTKVHVEECQNLLKLMGIPFVIAPCEAEAQCAELVKGGEVYGAGTEDMDCLTFGTPVLLRHLNASEAKKMNIQQFDYQKILQDLNFTSTQFIDLCILLGCDYCESIRGIGPKRAVELIKKYSDIETIIKNLDKKKYGVPDDWQYEKARQLFVEHPVTSAKELDEQLKWLEPNEEELVEYMVKEKGFSEDRIRNGCIKLRKAKNSVQQGRIDSFFTITTSTRTKIKPKTPDIKKVKSGRIRKSYKKK
ncbi:hypothetical protein SNEBB_001181 [Seison nebaliae]|nr:hypothetical protein SNEBB_001181 [Seison nebaliae]